MFSNHEVHIPEAVSVSVCVCECLGDVAQDRHLQECKLVSSFFLRLWTPPALSIPSHSTYPCHLTRNALHVPACGLPVYAAGISGWEIWGVFCQWHLECHKSWSWWTWQAQSCLQSSAVSSADSSSWRYVTKMRKCSFMQPITLWTHEHLLPLLYHDNPKTAASGCTADRNIILPDSQSVSSWVFGTKELFLD